MDNAAPAPQKPAEKPTSSNNTDGDHDSGVDETTQRKDAPTTNGDLGSPSKSPSKIPAPKRLSMPSPTKGSTKGSPKTPEAPPTADKKKVPMNKIQVGAAPSPNLKTVKSKIGSLQNSTHKPGGGNVKIENRKLDWKAQPRIAAKNDTYQPGGGDKKIQQVKLQWNAKPKVGSLDNAAHKPGGGEKKIESVKLDFKDKAKPKVGSKDNIKHAPGGGNVKTPSQDGSQDGNPGDIEEQKLEIKAQSKIGSLDNVKHRPGGGDKKIFDDKDYLRQMSGTTSKAGSEGIPSGTQGDDGWSSANTSRRTSRDRRRSSDRRYRSESRLGLRTPEPRTSPKEEHCSLREKHNLQQQEVLREAEVLMRETEQQESFKEQEESAVKEQELISPLRSTSPVVEQTMARDSSEDKDLNSNQTNGHSDCSETKNELEVTQTKANGTEENQPEKVTNISTEEIKVNGEPVKDISDNHKKEDNSKLKEIPKSDVLVQENKFPNDSLEIQKQELKAKDDQKVEPEKHGIPETLVANRKANGQNGNFTKNAVENISKTESKEDKVKEIKEVDCKEVAVNQMLTTIKSSDKINQPNQFDVNMISTLEISTDKVNSSAIQNQKGEQSAS